MTRIAKILAIFLAVASLSFMGFAIATTFGGPDWDNVMRDEAFRGYRIGQTPEGLWQAVRGSDEQQVGSSTALPEVLVKVLDDYAQRQQQEINKWTEQEPGLKARVDQLQQAVRADREALAKAETETREQLAQVRQQESALASQVVSATAEAQKLENTIASRREDILRLQQQVHELQADAFRLQEIRVQLNNLLRQTEANLLRAKQREQSLQQRVPYDQAQRSDLDRK